MTTRRASSGPRSASCCRKNRVKLLLNLLVMAAQGIPRGGEIIVTNRGG